MLISTNMIHTVVVIALHTLVHFILLPKLFAYLSICILSLLVKFTHKIISNLYSKENKDFFKDYLIVDFEDLMLF